MNLSKFEIGFFKCISMAAVIQGLVWAGMSLGCIILYNASHDLDKPTTYADKLSYELYYRFLKEKNEELKGNVIRPPDFTAFMWVYFLVSSIWVALSIDQYFAAHSNKKRLSIVMSIWSVITIALSIVDIILMSLVSRDYISCVDEISEEHIYCHITNGIGLALAGRGFFLWIVNVLSACVMLSFGIMIHRVNFMSNAIRIPRAHLVTQHTNNNNAWPNPSIPTNLHPGNLADPSRHNGWPNPSTPTNLHPPNRADSPRNYLRRDISQSQSYDQRMTAF